MSFLAGLLPAIGGLIPGIVSTVGKVVGKLGQGDFKGALSEVGNALSGDSAKQATAGAVSALEAAQKEREKAEQAKLEKEKMELEEDRKFEKDLERKRKIAELEYELAARRRVSQYRRHANDILPVFHGRRITGYDTRTGPVYEGPKSEPQGTVSSGAPIEEIDDELVEEEVEDRVPLPRRQRRNDKKKRRR